MNLPYYPLSNTGANDANKINADLAALRDSFSEPTAANGALLFGFLHKQEIDKNFTVPADYSFISADSNIKAGYTVTVNGTWVVL